MKETKLTEVYCRPKTEEEWKIFGLWKNNYCLYAGSVGDKPQLSDGTWMEGSRTEVTVQHFLDLLNDSIVPWRLEEAGFTLYGGRFPYYEKQVGRVTTISWAESTAKYGVALSIEDGDTWLNIETFTDLLTLIRFLSPT